LLTQGMVLNEIYFRKTDAGRVVYSNPAEVEVRTDGAGKRIGAVLRSDGQPVEYAGIGTMSKSKNNGVDPQALIEQYGADTARFFTMFTSPPDQTLEWSDAGVEGSFRYLRRLWSFAREYAEHVRGSLPAERSLASGARLPEALAGVRREVHLNLRQANFDLARHQFNTVASACMKILNALERAPRTAAALHAQVLEEGLSILLRVQAPITPHVCHHLWQALGFGKEILAAGWPEPAGAALEQEEIQLVLQVNGKLRGHIVVAKTASQAQIEEVALRHEAVIRALEGRTPKMMIVVAGRLVNVVV
jgi:leucyl-tRNA synthetase